MPNSCVHRLVGRDDLLDVGGTGRAAGLRVLVSPARLGDETLCLVPDRVVVGIGRRGEGRGPLADAAGAQHVVAEERELVLEPFAQLGQLVVEIAERGDESLVVEEVDLQPDGRPALAVQRKQRVVHAVVVEIEERVGRLRIERGRIERAGGHRNERLVEIRGDADARRVRHRVERAALLVLEGLPDAQVVERAVRVVHARDGGERAVGADDARPGERGRRALEELFAERVGARGSAAALVEEHRPVGHRRVDLGERRQAQLGEHPRRAGTHRRDELTRRNALPARGEQRQDLGKVRSKLPLRHVIAGTVREADEMRVALDESRHHRASVQIDDALSRSRIRCVSDRNEAAVADRDRAHHPILIIHRVDAPVDQREPIVCGIAVAVVLCLCDGTWQCDADACRKACLEEISP